MSIITSIFAYYLCLALAMGISSAVGMLYPSNIIAREISDRSTKLDKNPITGYIFWILTITAIFPLTIMKMYRVDMDEILSEIAQGLALFEE